MKINEGDIYTIILLFVYLVGLISPFHNICLVLLIVVYFFYMTKMFKYRSVGILKNIIVFLLLQNTFIGISCKCFNVDASSISIYSQVPFLFILISGGLILLRNYKKKYNILFYIYCLIILLFCYKGVNSINLLAYNVRNFITFYFAYLLGTYFIDDENDLKEFKVFYVNVAIFSGIIGIIGSLTNGNLYVLLGAADVANVKAMNTTVPLVNGLPNYFMGDFFGKYYARMGSLYLEPVNYSCFLALAVVIKSTELKTVIDYIQFVFLCICSVLTFGKGGLLIEGICLLLVKISDIMIKYMNMNIRTALKTIKWQLIVLVLLMGILYGTVFSYNMHFVTITTTFEALKNNPFGFGVGTVGNTTRFGDSTSSWIGAETGLLNLWCQIGIFGLIFFVLILLRMSRDALRLISYRRDKLAFVFSFVPVLMIMVYVFQENTFTPQVITGFMFIQGFYSKNNNEIIYKERI